MKPVPALRIAVHNQRALAPERDYVLYWPTACRRMSWNFGLQRALELCRELDRPLLVLDALRADYPWASERLHTFALQCIADDARACAQAGVQHYAYVEPALGAGKGLLAALAEHACAVVGDEYPCFMHPHMHQAAARQVDVRFESVDSNGVLPLRACSEVFPTAYAFRRYLQRNLPQHLGEFPHAEPLAQAERRPLAPVPASIEQRWPRASEEMLRASPAALAALPIDHAVRATDLPGGERAAEARLQAFLTKRLVDYEEKRSEPDADAASGLSPYLHFGALSIQRVFTALAQREEWTPERLSSKANGSRGGWWGMSTTAESFLDEALTWRELGLNFCSKREDYDRFESLPLYARQTLEEHAGDPRPTLYDLDTLAQSRTHDGLWNAAQHELASTGRMHNYLRMLWGKKVLEWSSSPRDALAAMIELNNKYALDGRDPNSYSGIFWCLGRYDRPWGPERAIFGKIRYMSSQNTARKFSVDGYLARFGVRAAPGQSQMF